MTKNSELEDVVARLRQVMEKVERLDTPLLRRLLQMALIEAFNELSIEPDSHVPKKMTN